MSTREDFKRCFSLSLDFSAIELEPDCGGEPYFCTPEGAEIVAWSGSGTHFVLLPGDETVYCVEPELGNVGTFVLPVGGNFREFLSHLLYCGGTSPLAQIFLLDEPGFHRLLKENAAAVWPGCQETFQNRDRALQLLAETFDLEPQDPFARVKALQAAFEPEALTFSHAYYDILGLEDPRHPESDEEISWCGEAAAQICRACGEEDGPCCPETPTCF